MFRLGDNMAMFVFMALLWQLMC